MFSQQAGRCWLRCPRNGRCSPAQAPVVEEEFPWHDSAISLEERLKLAEDKPHERKLMAAMAQLDCGACGYVCKTYGEAIARGEEKDLTRCTPGGRDTSKMLKQLVAAAPKNVVPVADVGVKKTESTPASDTPMAWDRNNPYPARLLHSKMLNSPISSKDTRHVVIDLRNSGLTYKPGDALGLFAENCPDLVADILDALGLGGRGGRSGMGRNADEHSPCAGEGIHHHPPHARFAGHPFALRGRRWRTCGAGGSWRQ